MSVKVMGQVWELDLPANEMLVLLALTDHADHEGKNIYPGVPLVAWKTGYSENQTRVIIHQLVEKGLLYEDSANPGKRKIYHVDFATAIKKTPRELGKAGRPSKNTPHEIIGQLNNTPIVSNNTPPVVSRDGKVNHQGEPSNKDISPNGVADAKSKKKTKAAQNDADAAADKPARQPNPMYDAIFEIWGYTAGLNGRMQHLLEGKANVKGWQEFNIEPAMSVEELREWHTWYKRAKNTNIIVAKPIQVQSSVGEYRAAAQVAAATATTPGHQYKRTEPPVYTPEARAALSSLAESSRKLRERLRGGTSVD